MKPEKIYHIYNHGNADDNLFRTDENYLYFLRKYKQLIYPMVNTYAFCLMPNHFHFLLKVKDENSLIKLESFSNLTGLQVEKRIIKQFGNFFNGYSKAFNKMFGRKGKLFLLPFKRKPVANSVHFLNTWKYIHYNPVHHGFCAQPIAWPFSSIHDYNLKNSDRVALAEAQRNSDSILKFGAANEFRPDWNDFIDIDY